MALGQLKTTIIPFRRQGTDKNQSVSSLDFTTLVRKSRCGTVETAVVNIHT